MRNIVLYIAMSLDGFIADENGGIDWLKGQEVREQDMGSYPEFIKTVDTVVMGYNTYNQIITELSPERWFYEGMDTYVMTHKQYPSKAEIFFTNEEVKRLLERLQQKQGKDIWICGGAHVADQLIKADLIDRYHITVIPAIMGKGVRLFQNDNEEILLKLISSASYNGMVDLVYERRN